MVATDVGLGKGAGGEVQRSLATGEELCGPSPSSTTFFGGANPRPCSKNDAARHELDRFSAVGHARGMVTSIAGPPQGTPLEELAGTLVLGALLSELGRRYGGYDLVAHWTQGEFHHDVILGLPERGQAELSARVLVVATNCNGGIKELLALDEVPDRSALWHFRCPGSPEFSGALPRLRGRAETVHAFDPCELLSESARSELRAEFRRRQSGGGWEPSHGGGCKKR